MSRSRFAVTGLTWDAAHLERHPVQFLGAQPLYWVAVDRGKGGGHASAASSLAPGVMSNSNRQSRPPHDDLVKPRGRAARLARMSMPPEISMSSETQPIPEISGSSHSSQNTF